MFNQDRGRDATTNYRSIADRLYFVADDIAQARKAYLDNQNSVHNADKRRFISGISRLLFNRELQLKAVNENQLKHKESELGARLFGGSTDRKQILFFNEDHANWYFYQGVMDVNNRNKTLESLTLHYEVKPETILRIDNHKGRVHFAPLVGEEFDNFINATEMYYQLVMKELYFNTALSNKKQQ